MRIWSKGTGCNGIFTSSHLDPVWCLWNSAIPVQCQLWKNSLWQFFNGDKFTLGARPQHSLSCKFGVWSKTKVFGCNRLVHLTLRSIKLIIKYWLFLAKIVPLSHCQCWGRGEKDWLKQARCPDCLTFLHGAPMPTQVCWLVGMVLGPTPFAEASTDLC